MASHKNKRSHTCKTYLYVNCNAMYTPMLNMEGDPLVTYGASCFAHKREKIYLYRSKFGHWCIGEKYCNILGNI